MNGILKVVVTPKKGSGKLLRCRRLPIREKLLKLLFGEIRNMVILAPEEAINEVFIKEASC